MERKILEEINKVVDLYDEVDRINREIERLSKQREQIVYEIGLRVATIKYLLRKGVKTDENQET